MYYDYKNRLVRVELQSDGKLVSTYEYDTFNRRKKKTEYNINVPGEVAEETRFFYDNWNVLEEWN